jgi:hypothetical protein
MTQSYRNPLTQALGLVFQSMRDKMGGIPSADIAAALGLAASHYRMIEAGSANLQPSRAVKIVQTFDTIEFVPLCQVLVAIQTIDSAMDTIADTKTMVEVMMEIHPALRRMFEKFQSLWETVEKGTVAEVARKIRELGIDKELGNFLTTEPISLTAEQANNFMSPSYLQPISGQLYYKIGNILQGLAPFYLDTVLQLIDNLRDITPRVTPTELARWESQHKNRISYIVGVVRKPEIVLEVNTFDYSFLWQDSFRKMCIIHRDPPTARTESVQEIITQRLRQRYEAERVKYERELTSFDSILPAKLLVRSGAAKTIPIDQILLHRDVRMNNLWFYFMTSGYVVPFIDNTSPRMESSDPFGTSLAYEETCEKLGLLREISGDFGFEY